MNQGTQPNFPQGGPDGLRGGPPGGFGGGRPGGLRWLMVAGPWAWFVFGVTLLVLAVAFYQIYKKAGFNGLLGLLMMIPIVNLGVMLWFAFAEWPVLRQLREARALEDMRAQGIVPPAAVGVAGATDASTTVAGGADSPV